MTDKPPKKKRFLVVPYYRVSTERQGKSGLGLGAQHAAVHKFILESGAEVLREFTEIETGRSKTKQIVLREALDLCRRYRATLLIAELDRLGRRVAFIATLMESRIKFICTNYPHDDITQLHQRAVNAEAEGRRISKRTSDALQELKAQGKVLGVTGKEIRSKENAAAAAAFLEMMRPKFAQLDADGFKTIRVKVAELNRQQIPTYRGGANKWHFCTVQSLARRLHPPTLKVGKVPTGQG